ncbi:MAG: hypothetical protein ABFC90_12300 [Bacteroidales bacterium]
MRKLNHFGIPVTCAMAGEMRNEVLHLWYTDVDASSNKIEFLRFDKECPFPEKVKTMPHIAYEVNSMEDELKGATLLYGPFTPVEGMDVAFIEEEGIPIELDYFY